MLRPSKALVDTLLAKDPWRRFESAAELQSILEQEERSVWWRRRQARLGA